MRCPGQDTRYWKPGDIFETPCPECGKTVEFFKDDSARKCRNCGTKVLNPKIDFGCAAYCKFADQCLKEFPPEILAQRKNIFKDRVACEMRRFFGDDIQRISHALKVEDYAGRLAAAEHADPVVVITAAYLHDIGIQEAEKKYQSAAPRYQEELGQPIAREILASIGADQRLIEEVCDIVGHHHHPRPDETINFKCLYDADLIANIEAGDIEKPRDREKLSRLIDSRFLTETGKRLAREILLKNIE